MSRGIRNCGIYGVWWGRDSCRGMKSYKLVGENEMEDTKVLVAVKASKLSRVNAKV